MNVRYVILHHTGIDDSHYDLMYESSPGGTLATWRLPAWPVAQRTPIERLPDHRRDYLTYEGPVSNNRGQVKQIHSGTCQVDSSKPNSIVLTMNDPGRSFVIAAHGQGFVLIPASTQSSFHRC